MGAIIRRGCCCISVLRDLLRKWRPDRQAVRIRPLTKPALSQHGTGLSPRGSMQGDGVADDVRAPGPDSPTLTAVPGGMSPLTVVSPKTSRPQVRHAPVRRQRL